MMSESIYNCHMTEKIDVIIVGADHSNTLWIVRSLGLANYKPMVIVVKSHGNHSFVAKSRYVKKSFVVNDEVAMINILRKMSFTSKIPIISSSDVTADSLDQHYDELSLKYIIPNCKGRQGELSQWMDKKTMLSLAQKVGFRIPYSIEIDYKNIHKIDFEHFPFPCIVKPLKSSLGAKTDFKICKTEAELKEKLTSSRNGEKSVLVQEFIKPDFEISILGIRDRQSNINIIPGIIHKVSTCKSIYNLGMSTFAYVDTDISLYIDKVLIDKFLNEIDYEGLYSIEFFVAHDKVYFLEINLRVDGNLFIYTAGGVNMPALWVSCKIGNPLHKESESILVNKTFGMREVSYFKYFPWKKPWIFFRDIIRTNVFSIWYNKDPMPFIYKFIYAIIH